MSYENIKNFRTRLKERATYVLGNKCQICGYDKCIQALDFHHVNPEEKEFDFKGNTNRSWQATRNEIQKCILLCANCHREVHAGLIDLESLQPSFSEERALEIDKLVDDVKTHKIIYCKDCGCEITKGAERCVECSMKAMRKVQNRPSKEELYDMLLNVNGNFTKIAKQFGVSDNTIRKWCKAYNIPSHSSDYKIVKI